MSSLFDDDAKLAFLERQRLREEFEDDVSAPLELAVPANEFGSYGSHQLVGHGVVYDVRCGKFQGYYGCLNVEEHNCSTLDGKNYRGKIFAQKVFHSCDRPSCPICFRSWGSREARRIELRFKFASAYFNRLRMEHLGQVEHIIVSVPLSLYYLGGRVRGYEEIHSRALKALRVRGVAGGCMIFHGFRFDERGKPYWSPHFHVLGMISGGYGCRGCLKECSLIKCNGFENRTRDAQVKDGFIVKIAEDKQGRKDIRSSIFATAKYQLSHASIRSDVVRPHAVTWFGLCGCHKLHVPPEFKKEAEDRTCPICGHKLVKLHYLGKLVFIHGFRIFEREFYPDLYENGELMWEKAPSRYLGS